VKNEGFWGTGKSTVIIRHPADPANAIFC